MRYVFVSLALSFALPAYADDEPALCKALRERITHLEGKRNKEASLQMNEWLKGQQAKTRLQMHTLGCKGM